MAYSEKIKYPSTGPEGSRKLKLPDFQAIGILRW
jgi:hypothetical protein